MAWNGVSLTPGAMESEATAATEGDTGFQRLKLANATTLQGDRGESCGGTDCAAVGHFEVVDFQPLGGMRVKSGYYQGNASAGRAVYVGFQPDAVLVKRVGPVTDRWSVLRTSSMSGDNTKDLDNAGLALAGNLVQSLTTTGFTVGSDARVNENLRDYYWVAFQAADGEMKVGQYSGNGAATRSIPGVGFQPDYLIVMPDLTADPNGIPLFAGSTYPADTSFDFDATQRGPNCIRALESDGFQVGTGNGVEPGPSLNGAGVNYYYVAWNAVPGRMAVGTYAGDDAATRNLDVAGFFPEWVVVKKFPDGTTERPPTHKPASTGTTSDLGLRFVDSPDHHQHHQGAAAARLPGRQRRAGQQRDPLRRSLHLPLGRLRAARARGLLPLDRNGRGPDEPGHDHRHRRLDGRHQGGRHGLEGGEPRTRRPARPSAPTTT